MDYLREGIHLRALGQKDPLSEYRLEGHTMFDETMNIVKSEFVRYMFHLELEQAPEPEAQQPAEVGYSYASDPIQGFDGYAEGDYAEADYGDAADDGVQEAEPRGGGVAVVEQRIVAEEDRVGRNDPCPCGSGKKYKKCHGA